jgi:hypothetical protein
MDFILWLSRWARKLGIYLFYPFYGFIFVSYFSSASILEKCVLEELDSYSSMNMIYLIDFVYLVAFLYSLLYSDPTAYFCTGPYNEIFTACRGLMKNRVELSQFLIPHMIFDVLSRGKFTYLMMLFNFSCLLFKLHYWPSYSITWLVLYQS